MSRLVSLLALMRGFHIDVACVQEARVSRLSFPTVESTCRAQGYEAFMSEPHIDDEGRITGRCLVLTRCPAYPRAIVRSWLRSPCLGRSSSFWATCAGNRATSSGRVTCARYC